MTTQTWVLFGDGSLLVSAPLCPDCSGDERVLENITFKAGSTCTCTGTSLTLKGVTVESGASVTFRAPLVNVTSGVTMEKGSYVEIRK
jgi:hypothetical protein